MNSPGSLLQPFTEARNKGALNQKQTGLFAAWFISLVFHPLLMPTYLIAVVFKYCTDLVPLNKDAKVQLLWFVFISTYLLPSLATGLLWATGTISSLSLEKRSERLIPLMITALVYTAVSFVFLDYLSTARLLGLFMGAITLSVVFTAFITHFWKISSHMAGIGGLIGFVASIVLKTENQSLQFPLIFCIGISGAIASSRLYLHAHNFAQIIAGFFLGMVISWSAVYFFV